MTAQQNTEHLHVQEASLDGIRTALASPGLDYISYLFSWESTERGAALLFLGAGLHSETLAQNTWFQFDDNSSSVQYVVRLLDLPEGDNRGIFTTEITLEEAARLVDMCIEQAMGDSALQARREKNKSYHSW
jgi:hypothetical protein